MFHYFLTTSKQGVNYLFAVHHNCVSRFKKVTLDRDVLFSVYDAIGTQKGSSFIEIPEELENKMFRVIIVLNLPDLYSAEIKSILLWCSTLAESSDATWPNALWVD